MNDTRAGKSLSNVIDEDLKEGVWWVSETSPVIGVRPLRVVQVKFSKRHHLLRSPTDKIKGVRYESVVLWLTDFVGSVTRWKWKLNGNCETLAVYYIYLVWREALVGG